MEKQGTGGCNHRKCAPAVRMVREHAGEYGLQWEAMVSIAAKVGCAAETLRRRGRQAELDSDLRPESTSTEVARVRELEWENRELRQANEILQDGVLPPLLSNIALREFDAWLEAK